MSWWSCRSCFVDGVGLARTSRRSDRTGTGPLARLLLGHFHQRCVHKAAPARSTDHLEGNLSAPAVRSGQTGRENVAIQHPCRSSPVTTDAGWAPGGLPAALGFEVARGL